MTAQRGPGHWRYAEVHDPAPGRRRIRWGRVAGIFVAVAISIAFWWTAGCIVLRLLGG